MSWLYLVLSLVALTVIYQCYIEKYSNQLMRLPGAYLHNNVDSYQIKRLNRNYAISDQNECQIKNSCSK
jgi:hypothetical protein